MVLRSRVLDQLAYLLKGVPGTPATGTYLFSNISILGATSDGILLSDLGATTTFNNLTLDLPGTLASGISATAAGTVVIGGTSTIKTDSTTFPSIRLYENAAGTLTTPDFTLFSVISDNENPSGGALPPYAAIFVRDANPGFINISSVFTVPDGAGGTKPGTSANVDDTSGVPITVAGGAPL